MGTRVQSKTVCQPQDPGLDPAPVPLHCVQPFAGGGVVGVERPEPDEECGDHRFGGAGMAVGDLDGDAAAELGQDRHEYALGPGLDRDPTAGRLHEFGAGAAFARDEVGMRRHRPGQPVHGAGAGVAAVGGDGEGGHRPRQRLQ